MDYELFVGIDISKLTIDAVAFAPEDIDRPVHHVFRNNHEGFDEMLTWLSVYGLPLEKVLFCCEHTGIYICPLTGFMDANGLSLWVENGLHVKRPIGLKRGKSDKTDALAIAHYAFSNQHRARPYRFPPAVTSKAQTSSFVQGTACKAPDIPQMSLFRTQGLRQGKCRLLYR